MKNSKWLILVATLGGIFALVLMFLGYFISVNNQLVSLEQQVKEKLAQVENVYQRRADLIPNLVNTVKGFAKQEREVLEAVTQARASVNQIKLSSPSDLPKFEQAQGTLSNALSRLLVISEKYPELKSDQQFLALQSQLEGTENRIAVERMRAIEAQREYNTYIKKFPQSVVANIRNFKEVPYFAAKPGSDSAPQVQFE